MNTNAHESEKADVVIESVIGSAYEVSNVLGAGFLEKVYERALSRELGLRGLKVSPQVAYPVEYKGQSVGEYVADLLVEDCVLVELKCVDRFSNEHVAQCINYLKASQLRLALLVNFQKPRVEWRRIVYGPRMDANSLE
jgi:GxxExxY protein